MKIQGIYKIVLIVLGSAALAGVLAMSCTNTSFQGQGAKKKGKASSANNDDPDHTVDDKIIADDDIVDASKAFDKGTLADNADADGDDPIRVFQDDFHGGSQIRTLEPDAKNKIWAVTRDGTATYFELDGTKIALRKTWTGLKTSTGFRTYVTEGGAVFAGTGGNLHFIDPLNTPEGPLPAANSYKVAGVSDADRTCLVSYKKDKKRFLGLGYGAGKFAEMAMDTKFPYAPKWTTITGQVDVGGGAWGYSCFIDQQRLVYYSNQHNAVRAVNLKTMQAMAATDAPNGTFTSATIPQITIGPKGPGSYAIAGDRDGNVLNGTGVYTMTHEPKSDTIWVTGAGGGMLTIYPQDCFFKTATCTGFATYNMVQLGANVRPLSAMGNGMVAGMVRDAKGQVYVLALKNPKDPTSGLDVTRIAELNGDPYMYTDFTGATLYLTRSETTFEMASIKGFKADSKNRGIGFTWSARNAAETEWQDINFKIRCYMDGGDHGSYEEFKNIKAAGEMSITLTSSCKDKKYDMVDILLEQKNDASTLMNVRKVQVTIYQ